MLSPHHHPQARLHLCSVGTKVFGWLPRLLSRLDRLPDFGTGAIVCSRWGRGWGRAVGWRWSRARREGLSDCVAEAARPGVLGKAAGRPAGAPQRLSMGLSRCCGSGLLAAWSRTPLCFLSGVPGVGRLCGCLERMRPGGQGKAMGVFRPGLQRAGLLRRGAAQTRADGHGWVDARGRPRAAASHTRGAHHASFPRAEAASPRCSNLPGKARSLPRGSEPVKNAK